MDERGSAHRASVIQIFADAGHKRDEQGRFVLSLGRVDGPALIPLPLLFARGWIEKLYFPDSGPVLSFPG